MISFAFLQYYSENEFGVIQTWSQIWESISITLVMGALTVYFPVEWTKEQL